MANSDEEHVDVKHEDDPLFYMKPHFPVIFSDRTGKVTRGRSNGPMTLS